MGGVLVFPIHRQHSRPIVHTIPINRLSPKSIVWTIPINRQSPWSFVRTIPIDSLQNKLQKQSTSSEIGIVQDSLFISMFIQRGNLTTKNHSKYLFNIFEININRQPVGLERVPTLLVWLGNWGIHRGKLTKKNACTRKTTGSGIQEAKPTEKIGAIPGTQQVQPKTRFGNVEGNTDETESLLIDTLRW